MDSGKLICIQFIICESTLLLSTCYYLL
eukprot:SAG22_NODE_2290_length_2752_cov_2.249152_5_plen_27_part_01